MARKYLYIWGQVDGLTKNYHDGGGLAIVAESLAEAREVFLATYPQQKDCTALIREPDHTFSLVKASAKSYVVEIFPDAGCC